MKAPDKIYIQPNAHDGWFEGNKPNDNFVEYIRKDDLLEWLETLKAQAFELREEDCGDVFYGSRIELLEEVVNKIESL